MTEIVGQVAEWATLLALLLALLAIYSAYRSRAKVRLEFWYDSEGHFDFQVLNSGENPASNLKVGYVKRDAEGVGTSGDDEMLTLTMTREFRICGLSEWSTEKCEIDGIETFACHLGGANLIDFLVSWQSPVLLWKRTYRLFRFDVTRKELREYKNRRARRIFTENVLRP